MRFLAFALCVAFTYLTYRLYVTNSIAVLPVAIFTIFTYWLAYEITKFTKT